MPFIEVKVFERELSEAQTREIIRQLTDGVVAIAGEHLRSATWVVGGAALTLADVRAPAAGNP